LVAVINNGLNLLNVSVFYQNVTLGLLLLGALTLEALRASVAELKSA
jgi:ribose/xylose/arabinose/galactoside ABC-type transport system permease subunit